MKNLDKAKVLPTLLLTALSVFATQADAADPKYPVFVDVDRSITKQKKAADEAEEVVKKGKAAAVPILKLLTDKCSPVRDRVVEELVKWSADDLAALTKGLKVKDSLLLESLAEVFEETRCKAAVDGLIKALKFRKTEDAPVAILRALAAIGDKKAYKPVEKLFKKEKRSFRVRGEALRTLFKLDPEAAKDHHKKAFEDKLRGVRIMALVLLAEADAKAGIIKATEFVKNSAKDKDEVWASRLLFVALDTFTEVEKRSAYKDQWGPAIEAMIARLKDGAIGREKHEIGLTLTAITGETNVAPEGFAWASWWEARKDKWEPKDKVKKKKGKKGEDDEGKKGGTMVRFHGVPIHSLKITFVQDISGGMKNPVGGRDSKTPAKLDVSLKELNTVLTQIDKRAFVNLLYFATFYFKCSNTPIPIKKFRKKLVQFNSQQKIPAKKGHGRSNIFDSMAYAIAQPNIDTVFVLTEGGPSEGKYVDTDRFMKHLKRLNLFYRARIHTLLLGKSTDGPPFLRALAAATGGKYYDLKKLKKS